MKKGRKYILVHSCENWSHSPVMSLSSKLAKVTVLKILCKYTCKYAKPVNNDFKRFCSRALSYVLANFVNLRGHNVKNTKFSVD